MGRGLYPTEDRGLCGFGCEREGEGWGGLVGALESLTSGVGDSGGALTPGSSLSASRVHRGARCRSLQRRRLIVDEDADVGTNRIGFRPGVL